MFYVSASVKNQNQNFFSNFAYQFIKKRNGTLSTWILRTNEGVKRKTFSIFDRN